MAGGIRSDIAGGIARIVLDDGKANALSAERLYELAEALNAAEKEGAVVVLSGREGIFSAGFDLKTFQRGADATLEMLRAGAAAIERLLSFPLPVLSVCTGHAYPMGAFLLLASDARIGLAGPWRIGLNEVAIGLTLPRFALEIARHRLSPPAFARVPSAVMLDPDEAQRAGYLDRVVPADRLAVAVDEEAARLRALDMPSFAATKQRVNERAIAAIREAVRAELQAAATS
jgi:enoyl-CoA hydratase